MVLNDDEKKYIIDLEVELARLSTLPQQQSVPASAYLGGQQKQNLVEWQLDFRDELQDIDRLIRSKILIVNDKGKTQWVDNPDKSKVFVNNEGANDIVRVVMLYLNKNTVLSNYREEHINARMHQMATELRSLLYNNYETYAMDNEYKINNYSMIVMAIRHIVESAYRRSLNGEERRDLNQARIVQQNEQPMNPMQGGYGMMMPQQNKVSKVWPWNWGR